MMAGKKSFRLLAMALATSLVATVGLTIPAIPDAAAQEAGINTTQTVGPQAADQSIALDANGLAVVGFATTRVDGAKVSVTGVKAARCLDRTCASKQFILRDRDGLDSPGVAIDSQDRPMMAYMRQGEVEEVWLARCETPECTTSSLTKIAEGDGRLDIALDADDNAVVAFERGDSLLVAHCADAACADHTISVIDEFGRDPSIALNSMGIPVISFKGREPRRTSIAVCADANCTSIANLADIPRVTAGKATSIAIDSNDNPVVAADDADGGMKVIWCTDPMCLNIELSGIDYAAGADSASLALDEFDNPVIAYHTDAVRILRCNDPRCQNITGWSFERDANYDNFNSPEIALDAEGRPMMAYQTIDNRVRLISCGDPLCGSTTLVEEVEYHIQNVATGEYLDPRPDGSVGLSATPTKRTRFFVDQVRGGVYALLSVDFETYVDAQDTTLSQSFKIQQDDKWRTQINQDGSYFLRSRASGAAMVVEGNEPRLVADLAAASQDRWLFVPAEPLTAVGPDGRVALQNVATGRWLDADKNGSVNQSRNLNPDDVWEFIRPTTAYVYIRNENYGGYLDADRDTTDVRTSASPRVDDRWDLVEIEEGIFTLRNVRFGGYLTGSDTEPVFDVGRSDTVTPFAQWRIVVVE